MTDTTGNFKRVVYMLPERVAPDNLAPRLHAFTGRIVLHAHAYGDTQSIWTLEPGSEQATQLRRFGLRPNFSPAGHKIVFTDTHKDNGRLWIMNWDGSGLTQLTF
jgi:hypothetical protein